MSKHGKKQTEYGALTNWKRQREILVRTQKKTDRARQAHFLETEEGGTCQDTEENRPSEGDSLAENGRRRDLSEHGKNPTNRGALTVWRR